MSLQHRRMQGIGAARQLWMAAIHGQSVLRQVVAADRQEIDLAQQAGRHERRGGRLDHGAQLDGALNAEFGREFFDDGPHGEDFRHIGDHGMSSRTLPAGCTCSAARSWVRMQIGPRKGGANAAQAQRRILLRGQRQIAQRLVAAHVHQPQDQRLCPRAPRRCPDRPRVARPRPAPSPDR